MLSIAAGWHLAYPRCLNLECPCQAIQGYSATKKHCDWPLKESKENSQVQAISTSFTPAHATHTPAVVCSWVADVFSPPLVAIIRNMTEHPASKIQTGIGKYVCGLRMHVIAHGYKKIAGIGKQPPVAVAL